MDDNKFKCKDCDKEFSTKEALDMHVKSKHFESIKQPIKISKKTKNWILIIAIIVGVALIGYYFTTKASADDGRYDVFAQCLSDNNVSMYGAWWCSHCKSQKEMFGSSFQYINYIECSNSQGNAQLQVCKDAGINSYPTWDISGQKLEGVLTLEALSTSTNCTLP